MMEPAGFRGSGGADDVGQSFSGAGMMEPRRVVSQRCKADKAGEAVSEQCGEMELVAP